MKFLRKPYKIWVVGFDQRLPSTGRPQPNVIYFKNKGIEMVLLCIQIRKIQPYGSPFRRPIIFALHVCLRFHIPKSFQSSKSIASLKLYPMFSLTHMLQHANECASEYFSFFRYESPLNHTALLNRATSNSYTNRADMATPLCGQVRTRSTRTG